MSSLSYTLAAPGKPICWLKNNDITEEERGRNWLRGALLAEAAGLLHILGVIVLRRVALRTAGKQELYWQSPAWVCVILRFFAWAVSWCARCYSPDTTVAPIFLSVVLLGNLASAPSVLHEQFYGREVLVTFGCLVAVWVSGANDLLVLRYNASRVLVFDAHCLSEEVRKGMVMAVSVWALITSSCLALLCKEKSKSGPKEKQIVEIPRKKTGRCIPRHTRLARLIPFTLGLLEGAMHFVAYAGFPWCSFLLKSELDTEIGSSEVRSGFYPIAVIIFILAIPATYCELEGAKNYDCRFFVPAYTAVSFTTGTLLRALLKIGHVDEARIPAMMIAQIILIAAPFWISSINATIKLPRTLAKAEPLQPAPPTRDLPPLRNGYVEYLPLTATPLLEFGEKTANSGVLNPEQAAQMLRLDEPKRKVYTWLFGIWAPVGRVVPLCTLMIVPVWFIFLCLRGGPLGEKRHVIYIFLTLHTTWAVAGTALMNSIFSGIGRRRLQLCLQSDYLLLCQDGQKRRAIKKRGYASGGRLVVVSDPYDTASSSSEEDDDLQWQMVRHFVIVEVEIADRVPEDLRCLMNSIAASPLAKEQIGVVVCRREHTEQSGDPKNSGASPSNAKRRGERGVQRLEREFKKSFRWLMIIQDEPNGAERGRRSSVEEAQKEKEVDGGKGGHLRGYNKAALHVSEFVKTTQEVRAHLALITHTTVDSVFHPQYFSALTFAFLASGKVRNTTIWQPPVFQLKDYYSQPATVKHVSLFLAQEQLASLTDPLAVPLPKSTYSLPLNLVRVTAGCWEPSYYLPDVVHNTGVWTKCWLTTIGRSSVQPIFLPIICNAMPPARNSVSESSGNANLGRFDKNGASSSSSRSQFAQVQVYAQGLLELSYFWGALPLALLGRRGSRSVHLGRLLCLVGRSLPPLCRMAWSHIVMSTFLLSVLVNTGWLTYKWSLRDAHQVYNTLTLLSISALIYGVFLLPVMQIRAHLALMRDLEHIIPPPDGRDRLGLAHVLKLGLEGVYAGPFLFVTVAIAEWYAALQICTLGCLKGNAREGARQDRFSSPQGQSSRSVAEPAVRGYM